MIAVLWSPVLLDILNLFIFYYLDFTVFDNNLKQTDTSLMQIRRKFNADVLQEICARTTPSNIAIWNKFSVQQVESQMI
jgi:hypothetical protein